MQGVEDKENSHLQGGRLSLNVKQTLIFDMERILLQPANSLLQPAKKVRI